LTSYLPFLVVWVIGSVDDDVADMILQRGIENTGKSLQAVFDVWEGCCVEYTLRTYFVDSFVY
jgi:hypothetical protein